MLDMAAAGPEVNRLPADSPSSVDEWAELIRPDFTQGNVCFIAGAAKLIRAKKALKKSRGSFLELLEKVGMDPDKAERWIKIARNPVLANSAHARNLPASAARGDCSGKHCTRCRRARRSACWRRSADSCCRAQGLI